MSIVKMRTVAPVLAAILAASAAASQTTTSAGSAQTSSATAHVHAKGVRVLQAGQGAGPADALQATPAVNVGPAVSTEGLSPISDPAPRPIVQLCPRPFAQADLTLSGAGGFDRALSRELKAGKRVVIGLDRPFPDRDAPPAALAPWLSQVKAGGGQVTVKQYCKAARSMLGVWFAKIVDRLSGADFYRSARGYDVVLYADALDRRITQVEFQPRAPKPAAPAAAGAR